MNPIQFDHSVLDRMVIAVEKVRDRLRRATSALAEAGIPYAVVDGNAVAAWVAQLDPAAVRNTQDVDILLDRSQLDAAKHALAKAGFVFRHVKSIDMFLDGPDAKARDAVHIVFAGERVRGNDAEPAAELAESQQIAGGPAGQFQVVNLEALVRMKLTSNLRKDQVHLQDLIEVGLVDETWPARFSPELASRLQAILDDPDG